MKFLRILYILLFICSFTACDLVKNNNETRDLERDVTAFSDLTVVRNNGIKLFYKNNVLFSGEAWSSDKKTCFIICENGRLMELHGKNPNNTDAVVVNMRPGQEFGNGGLLDTFNEVFYLNDGSGNLIIRLGRVKDGFRHECNDGTIETITNQNFIIDAFPGHAQLLTTYEAVLDNEVNIQK